VVAVGVRLADIETGIALRGSAPPGGRSFLEEQDGHHPLKEIPRIGTPVDCSNWFDQDGKLLPERVGVPATAW
jgi:hypothetical protein